MAGDETSFGDIIMFGGNFAPVNFALCEGQLLPISQNTALFSLLGTTYGGNGTSTFALPDLRGRVPIGAGQGPGLNPRVLGESDGQTTVTLTINELPVHSHLVNYTPLAFPAGGPNDTHNPIGHYPGVAAAPQYAAGGAAAGLIPAITPSIQALPLGYPVQPTGSAAQATNNMQPSLAISFAICLRGIFPNF